jgi:catechol 2,3-dioxygenase-like lactoylglutathione lyase family enzyme
MVKLDHITIGVKDQRASRDWYVGNLGLKVEFEVTAGHPVIALQDDSGLTLFLDPAFPPPSGAGFVLTFQVDNVDAKYRELSGAGIRFVHPPQKLYWGYGAELKDPDGYMIYLWDEKSMREKGGASK